MYFTRILSFVRNDSGAVTVDFVVLTAAIVGLGVAAAGVVSGGVANASQDIETQLTGQELPEDLPLAELG